MLSRRTNALVIVLMILGPALTIGCSEEQGNTLDEKLSQHATFLLKGQNKHHSDNPGGAIVDYTKAIQVDPKNADAYLNRAILKGDLICIDKTEAYNESEIQIKCGADNQGAIEDLTTVIELDTQDRVTRNFGGVLKTHSTAYAYYLRGLNKGVLNDKNGACADWKTANKSGWTEIDFDSWALSESLVKENCSK